MLLTIMMRQFVLVIHTKVQGLIPRPDRTFLCGVCMCCLCLERFPLEAQVPPASKNMYSGLSSADRTPLKKLF